MAGSYAAGKGNLDTLSVQAKIKQITCIRALTGKQRFTSLELIPGSGRFDGLPFM